MPYIEDNATKIATKVFLVHRYFGKGIFIIVYYILNLYIVTEILSRDF